MHHFDQLDPAVRERLFHQAPSDFHRGSPRALLAHALGATLYVPGTRADLAAVISRRVAEGSRSIVIDLEDAVESERVGEALESTADAIRSFADRPDFGAMVFVRVRSAGQVFDIADRLDTTGVLAGFVLPKFSSINGAEYLAAVRAAEARLGHRLWIMPVLETPAILHRETRNAELADLRDLLLTEQSVLMVRFGATDLCGLYGIRRDRDLAIYDVHLVASLIADVVNYFGRLDGTGFAISGPVWEHFADHERIFRPQLRETPFFDSDLGSVRSRIVARNMDGLIREVILDRANGLTGKTVIHPTHVATVHAISVVTHEEFSDATDILAGSDSGVAASGYRNKMNEKGPHRPWARQTLHRAAAFGVAHQHISFAEILAALLPD